MISRNLFESPLSGSDFAISKGIFIYEAYLQKGMVIRMRKREKSARGNKAVRFWLVLFAAFAVLFLVSAAMFVNAKLEEKSSRDSFVELSELVSEAEAAETQSGAQESSQTGTGGDTASVMDKYAEIYQMNSDVFGWIKIAGTNIDYPVMYTPSNSEYYLRRAFDKSSNQHGVPFVDGRCEADSNNLIIYGHNMDDGTMFAQLLRYREKSFWESHRMIEFDTLYEEAEYEIIAVVYAEVYDTAEEESREFCYYKFWGSWDETKFTDYVNQVKSDSIYDTGVSAEFGDKLITLSTCSYHASDGRLAVVAVKRDS